MTEDREVDGKRRYHGERDIKHGRGMGTKKAKKSDLIIATC